ncbi:hypothetical protein Hanom_Chr04g00316101 [Helianthus anomalus]
MEQCGQELGMTSKALVNDLPSLVNSLTSNNKSALGKHFWKEVSVNGSIWSS